MEVKLSYPNIIYEIRELYNAKRIRLICTVESLFEGRVMAVWLLRNYSVRFGSHFVNSHAEMVSGGGGGS